MRNFPNAKRSGLFLISFALFVGLIGPTPAKAVPGPSSPSNSDSLFSSEAATSPESLGRVERDAVKAARAHLNQNATEWGIDSTQFQPSKTIDGIAGMSTVRFTQSINGVEVANSLLAITVNSNGSLLSYTKAISDYLGPLQAQISEAEATKFLKLNFAQSHSVSTDRVVVSEINLVIVDGALVDEVPRGKYLAWRATTSIVDDATSIAMSYLSQDGQTVLSTLPFVRNITADPFVCDLQTDMAAPEYVLPPGVTTDVSNNRLVNIASSQQGMPLCGLATSGRAGAGTEFAAEGIKRTWDYFSSVLAQDINEEKYLGNISQGTNGDLIPRISAFINVCATNGTDNACPYVNAFWVPWATPECNSGACSGIFLGQGFDKADDVIAHELAHGVTYTLAFDSALVDNSETAALSEAVSDVFGEAMDQLSVLPGEAPDPAWTMAEDVQVGGYRNLQKPSISKITKNWSPGDSHENSGPINRLAYVLANGGKIGKVKIKALGSNANSLTKNDLCEVLGECLGTIRMSQLVFATTSNLTATANYFDFGKQMMIACSTFVNNGIPGFKKSTCKNVAAALKAQGFTALKISGMTKLGKVVKGTETVVTANVSGKTGAPAVGQEMRLQVKRGNKWKTVGKSNSDGNGVVGFIVTWPKSETYRIITKTNGGVFEATGKSAKVKVS